MSCVGCYGSAKPMLETANMTVKTIEIANGHGNSPEKKPEGTVCLVSGQHTCTHVEGMARKFYFLLTVRMVIPLVNRS